MFLSEAFHGLRRAAGQWRLAALLYFANLALAAPIALPIFAQLREQLAFSPEGDRLLQGFSFELLITALRYPEAPLPVLRFVIVAVLLAALLANALAAGGVLEVLLADDARPLLHRFGRGAGRFFGRFVRAGLAAIVVAAVLAGLVSGIAGALRRRFEDSAWEPMGLAFGLGRLLAVGFVLVLVLTALDYARIRLVRDDAKGALRALAGALKLVVSHPIATLGLWAANSGSLLLVLVTYAALTRTWSPAGRLGIASLFLAQQALMLFRAVMRVALWAGEIAVHQRLTPARPTDVAPAPRIEPLTASEPAPAPASP